MTDYSSSRCIERRKQKRRSRARRLVVILDRRSRIAAREKCGDEFFDAYFDGKHLSKAVLLAVREAGLETLTRRLDDRCVVHVRALTTGQRHLTALIFEELRLRKRSAAALHLVSKT